MLQPFLKIFKRSFELIRLRLWNRVRPTLFYNLESHVFLEYFFVCEYKVWGRWSKNPLCFAAERETKFAAGVRRISIFIVELRRLLCVVEEKLSEMLWVELSSRCSGWCHWSMKLECGSRFAILRRLKERLHILLGLWKLSGNRFRALSLKNILFRQVGQRSETFFAISLRF